MRFELTTPASVEAAATEALVVASYTLLETTMLGVSVATVGNGVDAYSRHRSQTTGLYVGNGRVGSYRHDHPIEASSRSP